MATANSQKLFWRIVSLWEKPARLVCRPLSAAWAAPSGCRPQSAGFSFNKNTDDGTLSRKKAMPTAR